MLKGLCSHPVPHGLWHRSTNEPNGLSEVPFAHCLEPPGDSVATWSTASSRHIDNGCTTPRVLHCACGTVPAMNRNADKTMVGAAPGPGFIWASLCSVFLFFSAHPAANTTGAPYALLDARQLRITNVASDTHVIS